MIRRRGARRRAAAALGLAAALLLASIWLAGRTPPGEAGAPDPPWPDPPLLRLEPGAARAYAVEVHSEGRLGGVGAVGAAGGAVDSGAFALQVSGVLVLQPYPGEEREVGARLTDASLTVDGLASPHAPALGAPFSFRVDRQGRFTTLTFAPRLPAEAAAILEQLVRRLQVVLPHARRTTWRTRERDAAGIFRAEYRVDPAAPLVVEKRRVEYLPEVAGVAAPDVLASRIRLELWPDLAGVRRVEGSERLRLRSDGLQGHETVSFRYEPVAAPAGALPESPAALARARDESSAGADLAAAPPHPADLPDARAVGEALRRFADAFGRDQAAAEALVAAWLRLPGAPGALVGALDAMARDLDRAPLDAARRASLWRMLAQAGTPEAEAALLDAAVSPDHSRVTRRQAIGHFGQVTVARPEMVAGLLGVHEAGGQPGGDAGLGTMALLAAGALGHPDLAASALGRTVADALEQRLARAASVEERAEVLAAMGNAGEPCLPALRTALADPAPAVRAAAVDGFRRMEGLPGYRALLEHAGAELDGGVRARTAEMLGRLGPEPEAIAWAAAEASRDPDRRVRLALVDLLGAAGERSPEARAALEALRESDDREVRRRVLRYVPPRRE